MNIVDETRFRSLVAAGDISHSACAFLDGIKIGLRIRQHGKALPNEIDMSQDFFPTTDVDFRRDPLESGRFYLAETVEEICISNKVFGYIHTRSWIARFGLDCVGSSVYVAPGFGGGMLSTLILEVHSSTTVRNLPLEVPLAGLVLFELRTPARIGNTQPNRFPF